ncbi:IS200/IS605 family transposase [Roseimarinus sediminis]|uniref:IS200/IS605 family transposase n=1 Tax=Roseimarinus sediminis TaxID=1610899 RepID=UPI003D2522EF
MANAYHQIHLHAIFGVKYRKAILEKDWQPRIFGVIGNLINETGCKTLIVNGVEDHVHCLISLNPVIAVSDLMKAIKAKSSKYVNDNNLTPIRFEWQRGYGMFSYSHSQIQKVYQYIINQEEHHARQKFIDEYIEFLQKFNISYDERYVFKPLI